MLLSSGFREWPWQKMSRIALQFCYINFISWTTCHCSVYAGVSIKTEVGSRFEKSNQLYQQRFNKLIYQPHTQLIEAMTIIKTHIRTWTNDAWIYKETSKKLTELQHSHNRPSWKHRMSFPSDLWYIICLRCY